MILLEKTQNMPWHPSRAARPTHPAGFERPPELAGFERPPRLGSLDALGLGLHRGNGRQLLDHLGEGGTSRISSCDRSAVTPQSARW